MQNVPCIIANNDPYRKKSWATTPPVQLHNCIFWFRFGKQELKKSNFEQIYQQVNQVLVNKFRRCFLFLQLNDLQGALDRSMSGASTSRDDVITIRRQLDENNSELTKLRSQVCPICLICSHLNFLFLYWTTCLGIALYTIICTSLKVSLMKMAKKCVIHIQNPCDQYTLISKWSDWKRSTVGHFGFCQQSIFITNARAFHHRHQ